MYRGANPAVENNQLKIQELVVRQADTNLYVNDSGNLIILIGDSVSQVVSATQHVDAVPSNKSFAQSALSVVDSVAFTAGGNACAIEVAACTMATNDLMVIKFVSLN